jgi:two-component system, NarL family, sensor histidine kinase UhpB
MRVVPTIRHNAPRMFKRLVLAAAALAAAALLMLAGLLPLGAQAADGSVLSIDQALTFMATGASNGAPPTSTANALPVALPDDWSATRPSFEGGVWYQVRFDRPPNADAHELMAMYVERVCSNLEVWLNGERVYTGGRMSEPMTRNCHYPQLVTLPGALLHERANVIDILVQGHSSQRVASRQRAGGLSALKIAPQSVLASEHARALFWNVTAVEFVNLVLVVLGAVMLGLTLMNRREVYLGYFGGLALAWGLLSARLWWRNMPWDTGVMEFLFFAGFAPLVALAVQFLLSYADLRSRWIENALAAQWVLLPATLLLVGPGRLFLASGLWTALFMLELLAVTGIHLVATWRKKRDDFWVMAALMLIGAASILDELLVQYVGLKAPAVPLMQLVAPLVLIGIAVRLFQVFELALRAAEAGRETLEARVKQATAEIEHNFAQLAELRVEQVTEKERKRIAGDLHDDLGAKLLTIVHTSESERISTLAREALEEMRLSVRGLTGKPMRLADALADWRAETVLRLGQANIEADWRSPPEETEQLLPARGFVQTTRILREAVSNIIKHSGASHCKVRCTIDEHQFGLTVQDNGKGIPMELDGKLDRGHGMSSMKHRAKQMQGQCLVESGPGYGTVIRLTLPL